MLGLRLPVPHSGIGDKMELRELSRKDCESVRQWRNGYLSSGRTPYRLTKEMQSTFYDDVVCNRDSCHRYWGIHEDCKDLQPDEECSHLIGMGGIVNIQWENSIGEIGLLIRPTWRNKGCGKQAVSLFLDQAFNHLGLKTVFGECYCSNMDSIKFWLRIIKQYSGRCSELPNTKFWNGKYYNSLYFSIDTKYFREVGKRDAN